MIKHFDINKVGADYVIGDIHGCFASFDQALLNVKFDPTNDRLFSVGDLVDRGTESRECLRWMARDWFHAVRGNHEQMATYCED